MWASEIVGYQQRFVGRENGAAVTSLPEESIAPQMGRPAVTSLLHWLVGPQSGDDSPVKSTEIYSQYKDWSRDAHKRPVGSWIHLYKSWLLLAEVLNLSDFGEPARSLEFKPRDADRTAVAARHWYKTAAAHSDEFDTNDPLLPLRLPGHFSVRGDWFLAVQEGSRSDRLADQALDLLSSRRANIARLQHGLGLPTRVTVADLRDDSIRVKLFRPGRKGEARANDLRRYAKSRCRPS